MQCTILITCKLSFQTSLLFCKTPPEKKKNWLISLTTNGKQSVLNNHVYQNFTRWLKLTKRHKLADQSFLVTQWSTERISSFVDSLATAVYCNKTRVLSKRHYTDFNFIEKTQIPDNAVLATLGVSSLYTNIPQEERINVVCSYYKDLYEQKLPIRTSDLRELIRLTLEENSFKFNEKHFVQTNGITMGNKMAWSLSPLFSWWTWKNDC